MEFDKFVVVWYQSLTSPVCSAAISHVEFDKFVVVWYSNGDVAVHSGRVLSKVMRGLYQKLGFEGGQYPMSYVSIYTGAGPCRMRHFGVAQSHRCCAIRQ